MKLEISTSNQSLAKAFREAEEMEGISIEEGLCEICLSEGYEPVMNFAFAVADKLAILFVADYLYDLIKAHCTNISIGCVKHTISSGGQLLDVLKTCQNKHNAKINID